jgi:hypothetical protein
MKLPSNVRHTFSASNEIINWKLSSSTWWGISEAPCNITRGMNKYFPIQQRTSSSISSSPTHDSWIHQTENVFKEQKRRFIHHRMSFMERIKEEEVGIGMKVLWLKVGKRLLLMLFVEWDEFCRWGGFLWLQLFLGFIEYLITGSDKWKFGERELTLRKLEKLQEDLRSSKKT